MGWAVTSDSNKNKDEMYFFINHTPALASLYIWKRKRKHSSYLRQINGNSEHLLNMYVPVPGTTQKSYIS